MGEVWHISGCGIVAWPRLGISGDKADECTSQNEPAFEKGRTHNDDFLEDDDVRTVPPAWEPKVAERMVSLNDRVQMICEET